MYAIVLPKSTPPPAILKKSKKKKDNKDPLKLARSPSSMSVSSTHSGSSSVSSETQNSGFLIPYFVEASYDDLHLEQYN